MEVASEKPPGTVIGQIVVYAEAEVTKADPDPEEEDQA